MTARSVAELPSGGRWAYEPKFDGWRCLAFRQPGGKVVLQSRQQRWLTRYFPEVVTALNDQLSGGVVLDGELVVCCAGRLDFAALHHRLHGGGKASATTLPACLVVFDVLAMATTIYAHSPTPSDGTS
jgi:ATP-dependent DNA ligase